MSRITRGIIGVLGFTVLVAIGCEHKGGGAQPAAKQAPRDEAPGAKSGGEVLLEPDGAEPADDIEPPAKNPMMRGLETVLEALPENESLDESRPSLREELRGADSLLSQIKAENLAAIKEANRQQRVLGQDSPNVLLLVAPSAALVPILDRGQAVANLGALDRLAAEGVVFRQCRSNGESAAASHWSILTGRKAEGNADPIREHDFTLPKLAWQAGYTTSLIGECSLGGAIAGNPRSHGFDEWFGFRTASEAEDSHPEYLWNNGTRLRVVANTKGKRGEFGTDLLMRGVVDYLRRHRQGRPSLLYYSWSMPENSPGVGSVADRFEQDMAEILAQLEGPGLKRNTVVIVAAEDSVSSNREATLSGNGNEAAVGPLVLWAPGRIPGGQVVDRPCSVCDILPTVTELVGARHGARAAEGVSLLSELRKR